MTPQSMAWLDAVPMAALLCGRNGQARAINAAGRSLFLYDAKAPLNTQHWRVLLHPFGDAVQEACTKAAAGIAVPDDIVVSSGNERIVSCRVVSFDDVVLVTATDVTVTQAFVARMAQMHGEFEALFDAVPSATYLVALDGQVTRCNAAAQRDLDSVLPADRPSSITLRLLWEHDAPYDPVLHRPVELIESPAMRALGGVLVEGQRLEIRRPDGRRTIEAHATPIRDAQGRVTGAVLVHCDMTKEGRLEQMAEAHAGENAALHARMASTRDSIEQLVEERSRALLASQEEQVRERRLSAVGQLAAGVMHDVNNALNPIMAAAYLLRHHAESPDAVRDYADRIRKAAEIGAATASRVGRFIRQEPVHAGGDEVIDLSALADEVVDLTEPMRLQRSSETHEVRVERQFADGVRMRGLPGEIREALLNLVQNAIDAMPDGGTLTLRTGFDGGDVCIAVRDTGVGMSADVRERAFDPFFSTKGSKGTGLGLAEVYGIARRHRGTAAISSVPGRGTEVLLRFPRGEDETRVVAAPVEVVVTPRRILVVEDHDDGREFLRRILEGDGHTVAVAASVAEGRDQLENATEPFDLLLTDVGLPDGSGWALVKEARHLFPGLRVGVITGWEPQVGTTEAQDAEFVLRKPLRAAELKAHIAGSPRPVTTTET
ncbi:MAG: PAS domain-containing protein [Gemmatimonadaceae bacterium]|nr:PAS domain-containing protein [Gemmatimonadaceae bacterium]